MHPISRRRALTGMLLPVVGLSACNALSTTGTAAPTPDLTTSTLIRTSQPTVAVHTQSASLYAINIDASQRLRPISPLIYGLAGGSAALQK